MRMYGEVPHPPLRSTAICPGYPNTWEHDCNVGLTSKRAIIAYFKGETRRGFTKEGPCEDPSFHRCKFCNERFEEKADLRTHLREHRQTLKPSFLRPPHTGTTGVGITSLS